MRRILTVSLLITVLAFGLFRLSRNALAETTHVVISQLQVTGGTATDEFVELYNPTNSDISLSGWRLTRKASGSSTQNNLVASISGTIGSHKYFLIASPGYDGLVTADLIYSATSSSITNSNTVLLYKDSGVNLVDKVGFGTATDSETSPFPTNPPANGSVHRKNDGDDSDNNANDFEILSSSNPRNSLFIPPSSPTPSETPTPSPSPTPVITPTPTPINTPSPTPTFTNSPSPSPTQVPTFSPSPTETPIPSPTQNNPTSTPLGSTMPTNSPTTNPNNNHHKENRHENFRDKIKHLEEVVVNFCNKHFRFLFSQKNQRGGKERD